MPFTESGIRQSYRTHKVFLSRKIFPRADVLFIQRSFERNDGNPAAWANLVYRFGQ